VLSSPGGSVIEGLQMAGIINDKNLNTYIPKVGLDSQGTFASACSFMFFAGSERKVGGRLGVHQFSSLDSNKAEEVG